MGANLLSHPKKTDITINKDNPNLMFYKLINNKVAPIVRMDDEMIYAIHKILNLN